MKLLAICSLFLVGPLVAGFQWAQAARRPARAASSIAMSDQPLSTLSTVANPLNPLARLFDEFEKDFFPVRMMSRNLPALADLNMDVKESPEAFNVEVDVPGVKKDDIDVDVKDRYVQISTVFFNLNVSVYTK